MSGLKKNFLILIFALSFSLSEGQQTPEKPVSYRVFNPFIFNPAITGSKDYSFINLTAGFRDKVNSQLLCGDTRLKKTVPAYFPATETRQFSNVGAGAAVYHDFNGSSRNIGVSASAAYHLPVNKKSLSFVSFGLAAKAVQNTLDYTGLDDSLQSIPSKNTFFPNLDLGIYYYSPRFFAGLSATNLLGNPEDADSLGNTKIPVSQQYFFNTGYKIILHRALGIVLEPSIIVSPTDLDFNDLAEIIHPLLKLYLMDFCIGTYFDNSDSNSFFFQYRYPRFYLGAYFEIPKNTAYYINKPMVELTAGISLKDKKPGSMRHSRW